MLDDTELTPETVRAQDTDVLCVQLQELTRFRHVLAPLPAINLAARHLHLRHNCIVRTTMLWDSETGEPVVDCEITHADGAEKLAAVRRRTKMRAELEACVLALNEMEDATDGN